MEKKNIKSQTLVEDLVKQRPILTEEEMNSFYSYDEAVQKCMQLFDEGVNQVNQEYVNYYKKSKDTRKK